MLSNHRLEPLQVITLRGELESIEMVEGAEFLKVGALHAVRLSVSSRLLSLIKALLDLLVKVEHT